jgi:hypothetical protein
MPAALPFGSRGLAVGYSPLRPGVRLLPWSGAVVVINQGWDWRRR